MKNGWLDSSGGEPSVNIFSAGQNGTQKLSASVAEWGHTYRVSSRFGTAFSGHHTSSISEIEDNWFESIVSAVCMRYHDGTLSLSSFVLSSLFIIRSHSEITSVSACMAHWRPVNIAPALPHIAFWHGAAHCILRLRIASIDTSREYMTATRYPICIFPIKRILVSYWAAVAAGTSTHIKFIISDIPSFYWQFLLLWQYFLSVLGSRNGKTNKFHEESLKDNCCIARSGWPVEYYFIAE